MADLFLPERVGMALEILFGRWLACCVHPAAAWVCLPRSGRAALIATYFAVGYAAVLCALLLR